MDKSKRPQLRIGFGKLPPRRDEFRTAADTKDFAEMLKEALNG